MELVHFHTNHQGGRQRTSAKTVKSKSEKSLTDQKMIIFVQFEFKEREPKKKKRDLIFCVLSYSIIVVTILTVTSGLK